MSQFAYIWFWRQKTHWGASRKGERGSPPRVFDRNRKGERCEVRARGGLNSALLAFEDGYQVITSRSGIRRA